MKMAAIQGSQKKRMDEAMKYGQEEKNKYDR